MVTFVWRNAVQKGLLGGNRTWMTVFAVVGAVKVMRRVAVRVPATSYQSELKPGEALLITHFAEGSAPD